MSGYKEEFRMTADTKVKTLLYDFERIHGIRPNRITMGWKLADELANEFYYMRVSVQRLTEEERNGFQAEYEGIPVKIDYKNPNILEVGYMVKWMENKL